MGIAITKTLTSSSTALLSTNATTNGPSLSDTAMVTPDPPFVISNETIATYNDMTQQELHIAHTLCTVLVLLSCGHCTCVALMLIFLVI